MTATRGHELAGNARQSHGHHDGRVTFAHVCHAYVQGVDVRA